MSVLRRVLLTTTFAAITAGYIAPVLAQEVPVEGPVTTTALINVDSKHEVALDPSMLTLSVDGHATPVTGIRPVHPSSAQVAILIDDGLRGSFGTQLKDLKDFITNLPTGMQVLVGYMRNGVVNVDGPYGFTTDHVAAADKVRLPISAPGISASPYFCLSEFVKHWPSNQPGPRFVMMLTNGVDPYNGSTSVLNQDSPYVQTAQEDAQRNGVAVYSIPYSDAGFRGGRGSYSGQNYLSQVAEATGAEMFNYGMGNPVSLTPFLNQFQKSITESYTISFMANAKAGKRQNLSRIKLKTNQPDVKIHAPDGVQPGTNL